MKEKSKDPLRGLREGGSPDRRLNYEIKRRSGDPPPIACDVRHSLLQCDPQFDTRDPRLNRITSSQETQRIDHDNETSKVQLPLTPFWWVLS